MCDAHRRGSDLRPVRELRGRLAPAIQLLEQRYPLRDRQHFVSSFHSSAP
jgi:hypothetical protein